ncbi:general secretion pathway protein GspG [Balneola sp. EhC07]|uniref:type IV pilin protein n=1 Tax=Balneola sp. EhC07 TaxID=1849360 RepID=UPI0007F50901|nr:prepilin-type N-terminal cleavage/methylation domain-containing protein [Balneola sp. EhC07]OAN61001.1 general secretion pathway protein GspG [Balneola sp. EhC07]
MRKFIQPFIRDEDGFSLTELLIVLAIIGILIMIAVPIYQNVTTRAKTTEAKTQLSFLHTLQRVYHLENDTYSLEFSALGFEQEKMITEGGKARYTIEVESAGPQSYIATATSIIDFDGDGVYNKWQVDEEGKVEQVVPD